MSAARRHYPESEAPASVVALDLPIASEPEAEWRHYHNRFAPPPRLKKRRKNRRHRAFHVSASFVAGSLLLAELIALVWVYALDLKTLRYSNQLDRDIKTTSLEIALAQDQLASHNATPRLSQWASQLNYRKALSHEMDDVTSNAPLPAIKIKKDAP